MSAPPDDLAFRVFNEIGIISQLGTTLFERVMPAGMTLAQFTVLNHFVRLGDGRRPSDLARAFQITKATMTSTLKKLEAKGLVTIRADDRDGRGRVVAMTAKGRAMRETCIRALGPKLSELTAALGRKPLEAALAPLVRIRALLDASRD